MTQIIGNESSTFIAVGSPTVLGLTTTNQHVGTAIPTLNRNVDHYQIQVQGGSFVFNLSDTTTASGTPFKGEEDFSRVYSVGQLALINLAMDTGTGNLVIQGLEI